MARLHHRKGYKEERKKLRSHKSRKENIKNQRQLIMLACEGEKTERFYFEAFFDRLKRSHTISKLSCVIAPHKHTNPTGVLNDLLQCVTNTGYTYKDYEERWIVIDRDKERAGGGGHTLDDYMKAITRAKDIGVDVAWSNPSFELWYLLHFEYRNTGIDRDELIARLSKCLGKKYQKNDTNLFAELEPKVNNAIRNANRLLENAVESDAPKMNPATNVVKLVEKLFSFEQEKEQ